MILYEHPFNERTRYMIRLEYLFKQLLAFGKSPRADHQHVAFSALFDIMDVCERSDCRNWVLQEIEKQKMNLDSYRTYPEVDIASLDQMLKKLSEVSQKLMGINKLGGHIRGHEWLLTLRNRFLTPGATSPMDMPSYAAWLNGPEQARVQVMQQLITPYMPLYEAVSQVLHILRDAADPGHESTKENGVFEKSIGGRIYQMIRIWVPHSERIYPEISGNKHVVMIRFFKMTDHFKQQLVVDSLGFKMALCNV